MHNIIKYFMYIYTYKYLKISKKENNIIVLYMDAYVHT